MNLSIKGKALNFRPGLPPDFTGTHVADGVSFHTSDSFGRIIIQQIRKLTYTITCRIFDFSRRESVGLSIERKGLTTIATLKNSCTQTVIGSGRFHLEPMQYASAFARAMKTCTEVEGGAYTELLDVFWSDEYLHQNLPHDPEVLKLFSAASGIPRLIGQPYRPLTNTLRNIAIGMLERPYIPALQLTYLDDLAQDYLLGILASSVNQQWIRTYVKEGDLVKVQKAKQLIATDLHRHYTNEEIASIVGMHSGTLRLRFKQVIGKSMFDYLLFCRNQSICDRLLHTDEPIKAMHEDAGYRDRANFIKGFRKQFGCTPLDYRRDFGDSF